MSDNTEKDFGDFLVTQLGKLEPQAPHPPTYTDTRAQSYVRRKPDMVTDRSTHGHRYTHTDTDTYRHKFPKAELMYPEINSLTCGMKSYSINKNIL